MIDFDNGMKVVLDNMPNISMTFESTVDLIQKQIKPKAPGL